MDTYQAVRYLACGSAVVAMILGLQQPSAAMSEGIRIVHSSPVDRSLSSDTGCSMCLSSPIEGIVLRNYTPPQDGAGSGSAGETHGSGTR